jgi:hypothetical protein
MTYLPTSLPVYFYGMPEDRIYLIYSRFYDINFYKSGMEFVIAQHEDFSFDYMSGQIITSHFGKIDVDGFMEMIDRPEQRIKILKVHRNLESYADALNLLKVIASKTPRMVEMDV